MMILKSLTYMHNDVRCQGWVAYEDNQIPKPGVMVVHDWSGCNEFAKEKAQMLAKLGYVGFAIDMYGEGRTGIAKEEKQALMMPLVSSRASLRERIGAALKAFQKHPMVISDSIAAIGFCFGGLCVLDLARSGAPVKGVVSFHGLLRNDDALPNQPITAKVLALHGYNDPMVTPEEVNAFCQEMSASHVDWQVKMYGNTMHGFTNPEAHDPDFGIMYAPNVADDAYHAMQYFLADIL